MMEALLRDRADAFAPAGLAPTDEYFQAWTGLGQDRERSS
jgi:hypothetical protein